MTCHDLSLIQSISDAVAAVRQLLFLVGMAVLAVRLREENRK